VIVNSLRTYADALTAAVAPRTDKIIKMPLFFLKEEKIPTKWYTNTLYLLSQSSEIAL